MSDEHKDAAVQEAPRAGIHSGKDLPLAQSAPSNAAGQELPAVTTARPTKDDSQISANPEGGDSAQQPAPAAPISPRAAVLKVANEVCGYPTRQIVDYLRAFAATMPDEAPAAQALNTTKDAHPCAIECQRHEHKGYPRCGDRQMCDYEALQEKSIADLIPIWYEGGTMEQMLDEAYAQIRLLENRAMAQRLCALADTPPDESKR